VPASVKEKVGAALACKLYERGQDEREVPWQGFHFSRWNADAAFKQVSKELDTYEVIDKDWPVMVETPSGEEFPCYQYYYD
jgi:hypothetical protein